LSAKRKPEGYAAIFRNCPEPVKRAASFLQRPVLFLFAGLKDMTAIRRGSSYVCKPCLRNNSARNKVITLVTLSIFIIIV
jgi:hypothetical protein